MKKILLFISCILLISLLFPLYMPKDPNTAIYDGTNLVLEYKIHECGHVIRTVQRGAEELYDAADLPYPSSGVFDIRFTEDSNEPKDQISDNSFFNEGMAQRYTYYLTGEIAGTQNNTTKCCELRVISNETVPVFHVRSWAPTKLIPWLDFTMRHMYTVFALILVILLQVVLWIHYVTTKLVVITQKNEK